MATRHGVLTILVWCAACDVSSPKEKERVSAIDVVASSDTLEQLLGTTRSIALTAIPRSATGATLDAADVTWQSSDPNVSVASDGGAGATATWSAIGVDASTVSVADISATVGDVVGHKAIVACPVLQVAAKNSGTLLQGRTVSLVATAYGTTRANALASANVMSIEPGWKSLNPEIVSVSGSNATAVAPGETLLIASRCGVSDTVSVAVVSAGYTVTFVLTTGIASRAIALNDSGDALYGAGTPGFDAFWTSGISTNLGSCRGRDLNNNKQVLCFGAGPLIWESGVMSARDTVPSGAVAINDLGHVAGFAGRPFLWKGPGTFTAASYFPPGGGLSTSARTVTRLNALDDVVGSANSTGGYWLPMLWRNGQGSTLGSSGRSGEAFAVNDSGDAVGNGESLTCLGKLATVATLMRARNQWRAEPLRAPAPRGCLNNDVATNAFDINNRGEVVGSGSQGGFVWAQGTLTLLSHMIANSDLTVEHAVRINEKGQILAIVRNGQSPTPGVARLDPP